MRKPDREIYELTLERLGGGLRAEECVFVDDLDVNCATATELGMTAIQYVSAEQAIPRIRAAVEQQQ
jgi:putative hydrolase of the HAD superfamily